MDILDRVLRGRFGAEAKAALGFLAVAVAGTAALLVLAAVLGAASLTPFGAWAGLLVFAASAAVAAVLLRRGKSRPRAPDGGSADRTPNPLPVAVKPLPTDSAGPNESHADPARPPRLSVTEMPPKHQVLRSPLSAPVITEGAGAGDTKGLKRGFDQAFAAGRLDEAERILDRMDLAPAEAAWVKNKRRLVQQTRARR